VDTAVFFKPVNSQNSSTVINWPFLFLYLFLIWERSLRAVRSLRPVIFITSFAYMTMRPLKTIQRC